MRAENLQNPQAGGQELAGTFLIILLPNSGTSCVKFMINKVHARFIFYLIISKPWWIETKKLAT